MPRLHWIGRAFVLWVGLVATGCSGRLEETLNADAAGEGGSGSGGMSNTGGALATAENPADSFCQPVAKASITDFTYTNNLGSTETLQFGDWTGLTGSLTTFAGTGATLTSDVTQNNWHLSGSMAMTGVGFVMVFYNLTSCGPIDASKFKGLRFRVWGKLGEGGSLYAYVATVSNDLSLDWLKSHGAPADAVSYGTCSPPDDASVTLSTQTSCAPSNVWVPLLAEDDNSSTFTELRWSDFTGGSPDESPDPTEITGIYWALGYNAGIDYDFDLYLDDLGFVAE